MAPKLKLHRDDSGHGAHGKDGQSLHGDGEAASEVRTLPFPSAALAQRRLVAGRVNRRPFADNDDTPFAQPDPKPAKASRQAGDTAGRIGIGPCTPTQDVIRRLEQTLDLMQRRVDRLKTQSERDEAAFKFPSARGRGLHAGGSAPDESGDDLPPAA